MNWFSPNTLYFKITYRNRLLLTLIISELLLLSVFKFWPVKASEPASISWIDDEPTLFTEEMIQTKQISSPARPPRPQIPVPVPNDEVIEEEIELLDFDNLLSLDPIGEGDIGQAGTSDEIVGSPEEKPRLLKVVEPINPEAARKAGILAEVYVTFLVNTEGNVEDIFVSEIRKYDKTGRQYTIVNSIGYGIIEAALEVAKQWKFKPAMNNGKAVRAYTTQVFSFGF